MTTTLRRVGVLATAWLSSCATLFDGGYDTVTITSDPPGVRVEVDGETYETPVTVELDSSERHIVHGPNGESYPIASMPNRLVILDALLILPVFVDLATGAHKTLEPSSIVISPGSGSR